MLLEPNGEGKRQAHRRATVAGGDQSLTGTEAGALPHPSRPASSTLPANSSKSRASLKSRYTLAKRI